MGISVAAVAAVASAVAAWASLQQVDLTRRAARDAAVAGRQVDACIAISTAASRAESHAHRVFQTSGQVFPLAPADYAEAGAAFVEAIDVYNRHSLFLSDEQDRAGEDIRHSAIAVAAAFLAMRENPNGVMPLEVKRDLLETLIESEAKFRIACRKAAG